MAAQDASNGTSGTGSPGMAGGSGGDAKSGRWSALVDRTRLVSGLILFAYVLTHLVNHAFGLWSIPMMLAVNEVFASLWRPEVGTVALYGALLLHVTIALRSIYLRDSLRGMTRAEIAQLILGLCIPLLLIDHVVATRLAHELFGLNDGYIFMLANMWVWLPIQALKQSAAILVAWTHGCIGLHFWLRFQPWYQTAKPLLLALAVMIPTLALAGTVSGGMEVRQRAADPTWMREAVADMQLPTSEEIDRVYEVIGVVWYGFLGLLAAAIVARSVRLSHARRTRGVTLRYPMGRTVPAVRGMSVLDASRQAGIPHASVCGGHGRCSTCRVRIGQGLDRLPAPSEPELKVLRRISAPPNVRLACQTPVVDGLEVTPLLPPHASIAETRSGPSYLQGREMEIAVLFADIRGFTTLSESRLPYDVVFILNRYFAEMGAAIEGAGGRIDKFIGDGIMALFGVGGDPAAGARDALDAARAMAERLRDLNDSLAQDLDAPLRIGIGIHLGPCIVGEMGYGRVRGVTAVGDTVNTASRLEGATKEFGAQLIVSRTLAGTAGVSLPGAELAEIPIRGRDRPMRILVVKDAGTAPIRRDDKAIAAG